MFERYTEKARRTIFFARYEASQFGSNYITLEHLLLGLLREDPWLQRQLGPLGLQRVREYIVKQSQLGGKSLSTAVDLPLDPACQQVLIQMAEVIEAIPHRMIDSSDLVLGLLAKEASVAAAALRKFGIDGQSYRDVLAKQSLPKPLAVAENPSSAPGAALPDSEQIEVTASELREPCNALARLVDKASLGLKSYTESQAFHTLGPGGWIRKVMLGHLIDRACFHQQCFARALTERKIAVLSYPAADWTTAQNYRDVDWSDLTVLWINLNRLLVHVIAQVPVTKLAAPCCIGLDEPIAFERLIANYVKFCQDEMAEILTRR